MLKLNRLNVSKWLSFMVMILSLLGLSSIVSAQPTTRQQVELFEFQSPQDQKLAINIAKQLRCPRCQNQNLMESNAPIALDMRLKVYQLVDQGKDEQQVMNFMTDRFGEFVLYKPSFNASTWVLWLTPIFLLLCFLGWVWRSFNKSNGK